MKKLFILFFSVLSVCALAQEYTPDKRMRVIIDNDFSGDPDGLFQLAHHLLSPSVEICGIIGSPLTPEAGFDNGGNSAEKACQKARELMTLMKVGQDIPVVEDGASLIVREAVAPRSAHTRRRRWCKPYRSTAPARPLSRGIIFRS